MTASPLDEVEELERTAWAAGPTRAEIPQLERALRLREDRQGPDHPDIIWTLSLLLDAHRPARTAKQRRACIRLAERRLALRRRVLPAGCFEMLMTVKYLLAMYEFEGGLLDPARHAELRAEHEGLRAAQEDDDAA